jgi:hypothetical protein
MVNISLRVLSKPDVAHLPQIYRELGTDYDERVLPSIVNEVLKSVVAHYNAAQALNPTRCRPLRGAPVACAYVLTHGLATWSVARSHDDCVLSQLPTERMR